MSCLSNLAKGVLSGHRRSLSKALTLVESSRLQDRVSSLKLLEALEEGRSHARKNGKDDSRNQEKCFTIGFSGPPGAGKSTLIEAIGCDLIEKEGHKVAVLAYDPSSQSTGGALLGDKFRMPRLSSLAEAYIRPAPSKGSLGGVSRSTLEAMIVLRAAGYSRILIETVGVGQSEISVANLVDCLCLVMPPIGGDELQNIKRGITEVADIIAVNKADGDTLLSAQKIARSFEITIPLTTSRRKSWRTDVLTVSARTGQHLDKLRAKFDSFFNIMIRSGELEKIRTFNSAAVSWTSAEELLVEKLRQDPIAHSMHRKLSEQLKERFLPPSAVGQQIVAAFLGHCTS